MTLSARIDDTHGAADELVLIYRGTPAELVAAGAVTIELLAPVGRGYARVDADGDRVTLRRAGSNVTVERFKRVRRAVELELPGVAAWLRARAPVVPRGRPQLWAVK